MGINDFINTMYYIHYYGSYNATCTSRIKRKRFVRENLKARKGE